MLYTWGQNSAGQLGHGDLDKKSTPTEVGGLLTRRQVGQIACGDEHMIALTTGACLTASFVVCMYVCMYVCVCVCVCVCVYVYMYVYIYVYIHVYVYIYAYIYIHIHIYIYICICMHAAG